MLVLSIHVVESIFVSYKRILAEVSAAPQITHVVGRGLNLLFVSDFLLKFHPLCLQFPNFIRI